VEIYHKKSFVVGILLGVLAISMLSMVLPYTGINDPITVYNQYINAQRNGYEKIVFKFSSNIESDGKELTINQMDIEKDIRLRFNYAPKTGFYYWYFVVYNNGSILEAEKKFMPYGENRTLIDFPDVYLSIMQNVSGIVESDKQFQIEFLYVADHVIVFIIIGCISAIFIDYAFDDGCSRRYRY